MAASITLLSAADTAAKQTAGWRDLLGHDISPSHRTRKFVWARAIILL